MIELMSCAVRQASTGEAPVGRAPASSSMLDVTGQQLTPSGALIPPSKRIVRAELTRIQEDRSRLTEHFIPVLPALIAKVPFSPFSPLFLFFFDSF